MPVDVTVRGSGMGPLAPQTPPVDLGLVTDEVRNPPGCDGFMPGMPDMLYTGDSAWINASPFPIITP